jgi:hypothetical protein
VIVIGADSHKRTHTVVAVDQVGRWLGERTVRATSDGHLELLRWSGSTPTLAQVSVGQARSSPVRSATNTSSPASRSGWPVTSS